MHVNYYFFFSHVSVTYIFIYTLSTACALLFIQCQYKILYILSVNFNKFVFLYSRRVLHNSRVSINSLDDAQRGGIHGTQSWKWSAGRAAVKKLFFYKLQ